MKDMKPIFLTLIVAIVSGFGTTVSAQDIDQALSVLATNLTKQIKEKGKKKITVVDFTDLNGGATELGKYIAEELTVNFVEQRKDFSVLDRANLKKILAEHKLTASGLVDPENAKKLGQFAGVDALILGTLIPKTQKMNLNAKIITTDTAEIVGAARSEFKVDDTVQQLISKPSSGGALEDRPKLIKTIGDLRIELQSAKIANGSEYVVTLNFTNASARKSVWIAMGTDIGTNPKAAITDSNGAEFQTGWNEISGIAYAPMPDDGLFKATEIKPRDSITAIVKFFSRTNKAPSKGVFDFRFEILMGDSFDGTYARGASHNVVTKLEVL